MGRGRGQGAGVGGSQGCAEERLGCNAVAAKASVDPASQLWRCSAEVAALAQGSGPLHLHAHPSLAVSCPSKGCATLGEGFREEDLSVESQL